MPFAPDGDSTVADSTVRWNDATLEERGRRGCTVQYARRPANDRPWRLRPAARLVATVLALASVAIGPARAGAGAGARADAAQTARAGVVVDLGNGTVRRVGITFSGSISGLDALRAAGFEPTVRAYGGLGGAVCGVQVDQTVLGCPTDGSCLTCAAPNYWVYFRAPAGSTSFGMSRVGAGATSVHDGDVEGWRWGHGSAPAYVGLDTFFPPTPTTTVPAPTVPTTTPVTTPVTTPGTTPPSTPTTTPTTAPDTVSTPPTTSSGDSGLGALATPSTNQPPSTNPTDPASAAAPDPGTPPPDGGIVPARVAAADPVTGRSAASGPQALASGPPVVRRADASGVAPFGVVLFVIAAAGFGGAIVVARRRRATL